MNKSKQNTSGIDNLCSQMLLEIAETITRYASQIHLYPEVILDENALLSLLVCTFSPIQRSSQILMDHLYTNMVICPLGFREWVMKVSEENMDDYLENNIRNDNTLIAE